MGSEVKVRQAESLVEVIETSGFVPQTMIQTCVRNLEDSTLKVRCVGPLAESADIAGEGSRKSISSIGSLKSGAERGKCEPDRERLAIRFWQGEDDFDGDRTAVNGDDQCWNRGNSCA